MEDEKGKRTVWEGRQREEEKRETESRKIVEDYRAVLCYDCVFVYDRVAKKEDINTVLYEFEYE